MIERERSNSTTLPGCRLPVTGAFEPVCTPPLVLQEDTHDRQLVTGNSDSSVGIGMSGHSMISLA